MWTVIEKTLRPARNHPSTRPLLQELRFLQHRRRRRSHTSLKLMHFLHQGKHPDCCQSISRRLYSNPARACLVTKELLRNTLNLTTRIIDTALNPRHKKFPHRRKSLTSPLDNKYSNLINTIIILLLHRPQVKRNSRRSLSKAAFHLLQVICLPITRLIASEMLIRITTMEIMVSNRRPAVRTRACLSNEVPVHLVHLQQNNLHTFPLARLSHSLRRAAMGTWLKLKTAGIRPLTHLTLVSNSKISHIRCFSSKVKVRLEVNMEDIRIATPTMLAHTIPAT